MVIYATNLIKYLINECLLKSMSTIVIIVIVYVLLFIVTEMTRCQLINMCDKYSIFRWVLNDMAIMINMSSICGEMDVK